MNLTYWGVRLGPEAGIKLFLTECFLFLQESVESRQKAQSHRNTYTACARPASEAAAQWVSRDTLHHTLQVTCWVRKRLHCSNVIGEPSK